MHTVSNLKKNDKSQSGRSMVEMLGVLAIAGVVSIGSIGAYNLAINKHRTNELIYEATKRAQSVSTQLLTNNQELPTLSEFGETEFGGGTFGELLLFQGNAEFGLQINGVSRAVCEGLINSMGDSTVLRGVTDSTGIHSIKTCEETNDIALLFDRNLELGADLGDGEEGAENAPRVQRDTHDERCSGHGAFGGGVCQCEKYWRGGDCSIHCVNGFLNGSDCMCNDGWEGAACETASLSDADKYCNGHGLYDPDTKTCDCSPGWTGANCAAAELPAAARPRATVIESESTIVVTSPRRTRATAVSGEGHQPEVTATGTAGIPVGSETIRQPGSELSPVARPVSGVTVMETTTGRASGAGTPGMDLPVSGAPVTPEASLIRPESSGSGRFDDPATATAANNTPATTTKCQPKCKWTEWFDVDYPKYEEGGGDFETYEKIRGAGGAVCKQPQEIECEAENYPGLTPEQVGQRVHCDVHFGLVCRNDEQLGLFKMCYNYRMRVFCCDDTHCNSN